MCETMNRYQTWAALITIIVLSGCSKKTPYEIINRSEEAGGLVVSYRVGVPDSYTRNDLQGWCTEITQSEGEGKAVNIEFVYANRLTQQQGLCTSGQLYAMGDLRSQFGDEPKVASPPGMAPVPPGQP
jgi:hypothetical protein